MLLQIATTNVIYIGSEEEEKDKADVQVARADTFNEISISCLPIRIYQSEFEPNILTFRYIGPANVVLQVRMLVRSPFLM